jgi:hypothetical protein
LLLVSDIIAELRSCYNPLPTEPRYQVISQPIFPASNTTGTSDTAANGLKGVLSRLPVTDLQSFDELEKSLQQWEQFHALVGLIDKKLKFCFGS